MHFKMVNAFQNCYKWLLKYLYCIQARYEHFITHSQCQRHTNTNKTKQELLTEADYEHIKIKIKKQELASGMFLSYALVQ